ncbi:hypothetical protein JZ751_017370 [Albula glossodonta]|uniref:PH domain-containing protein n=1 Tax=Albula glossodonta TaxID=121402 RepID=A0A8T2PJQ2_9TELE|nr:hypothetical protein JZ751_017370 [Albula glossodonta]
MLKFRADRRVRSSDLDMNGKASGKGPVSIASDVNSNNLTMVSDLSPEQQPNGRAPRPSKKAATFGKRSNSMRRNPKAEVAKQGWLYKQASSGVKQWNKRWFVLTDRCLFYYKDEKEDGVLGSLPLLSFRITVAQPSDNISRKYAFKACWEEEEEADSNGSLAFCLQVEHSGIRTYYFSADSQQEQEDWNIIMVAKGPEPHSRGEGDGQRTEPREVKHEVNGVDTKETATPSTPMGPGSDCRGGDRGEDGGGGGGGGRTPQPNGWANHSAPQPSGFQGQDPPREAREPHENVVLRRGFVPRTQPERMAQRKSSMTQLQQWVNQRRGMNVQEDLRSPSRYYTVNRGVSAEYYGMYGGPQYVEDYTLYPPGVRPDSICSVSGAFDRPPRWTNEEKRRSLRDGSMYGRDPQWMMPPAQHPAYYGQMESAQNSMRRLSLQPRSRSVPRSPSSSSQGPYSPGPRNFVSPVRSPSARFERCGPGRMREDVIYADPSIYGLRRSISSPKYEYPGDRRSVSQAMYHCNYPGSPSLHDKMEDILDLQLQRKLDYLDQQAPPFHDIYRDMHPAFKANEMEISKLLGRLCEQNRLLKDQEAIVQRLRIDKDSLEGALVATHQELEVYRSQPPVTEKLQLKKETLQNQLINIRGELSQASSALTTTRMEFEALEDEVNAIHGDLWEQLNAGGQNELLHRHLQKEFWRIQDVLEGLHKNNPSRGTDTAKHRVTSGASGSFSTNSPASPLSSVSITSPLSPFSPISGSQSSPTKQMGIEDIGPPRPPLPKSYLPLESSPTIPPSVPPLPFDSSAWSHSMGLLSGSLEDSYIDAEESRRRQQKFNFRSDPLSVEKISGSVHQESEQDRQANMNKVGVVPPRTKSPTEEEISSYDPVNRRNCKASSGLISRERPKSAVFPAEVKSKMSVEEQNERIRRNQSSSMRDKRRSLNLSNSQNIDGFKPTANYRVVRRRLTAHEVDIKDLEAAVRGEGVESPREEIARLRRLQAEPDHYDLSAPDKVLIPERYLDIEPSTPLSPEEQREKKKKVERIKTLIAKSKYALLQQSIAEIPPLSSPSMQNVVPLLDGPVEGHADPEQQLQEQEKRIEISCALAAEASRRSRLLSAQCALSPSASPTSLAPLPSADFSDSSQFMKGLAAVKFNGTSF